MKPDTYQVHITALRSVFHLQKVATYLGQTKRHIKCWWDNRYAKELNGKATIIAELDAKQYRNWRDWARTHAITADGKLFVYATPVHYVEPLQPQAPEQSEVTSHATLFGYPCVIVPNDEVMQ